MVELNAEYSGIASNSELVKFLELVGVSEVDNRVATGVWQLDSDAPSSCETSVKGLISRGVQHWVGMKQGCIF